MKMKLASAVTALSLSTSGNAAVITHGDLVTDDTTNYITDTVSDRQYLRFDTFDLSYADTLVATSLGGIYEEWTIATSQVADDFFASANETPSTSCDVGDQYGSVCGLISGWTDGDFGSSHNFDYDYFWFESTADTPIRDENDVGMGAIAWDGEMRVYDDWTWGDDTDRFNGQVNINALLYRDTIVTPIPAAVWLFGSGLLGLIGVARRKI